jgi:hypothetical protein
LKKYSSKHRVVRRSAWCAYCGYAFQPGERGEDEHVIGRRFVPKGTLSGEWNLILSACGSCNDIKAELENDISAVTMQPDGLGRYGSEDPRLVAEARRKARTTNRRTGRFVSEPEPPLKISMPFGPATFSFNFTRPAQADDQRLFQLARLQLAGFFSMLTWNDEQQRGFYWPGSFMPVVAVRKEDWGNPRLKWVEEESDGWEYRLHAIAADTFYKVWIRRRLGDPAVWAWAMEWNHNFRLAGFFGEEAALHELQAKVPQLAVEVVHETPDSWLRVRTEVPLAEDQDHLFDRPDNSAFGDEATGGDQK